MSRAFPVSRTPVQTGVSDSQPPLEDQVQRLCWVNMQGHKDVVAYLLKQGVPWNAQDKEGNSAGEYAVEQVLNIPSHCN